MKILVLTLTLWSSLSWAGNSAGELQIRCQPSAAPALYASDFKWGYELLEMIQKFVGVYNSDKRLPQRAYWDNNSQSLKLPYLASRGGDITIQPAFAQAIARHIERAYELNYIDGVFFPDMGHSHLLIPEDIMADKYDAYPINQMSKMFEEMFQDSNVKVLYHTAEQLSMKDASGKPSSDPRVRFRYETRNIVGDNNPQSDLIVLQNPESPANTVSSVPGFFWWGAGFNISAHKEGCLEYSRQGQSFRFDLSMFDLEYDPNGLNDSND